MSQDYPFIQFNTICSLCLSLMVFYPSLIVSVQGPYQRTLLKNLLKDYNRMERPVANDSQPLTVVLTLSLAQIMDVVRPWTAFFFSVFHFLCSAFIGFKRFRFFLLLLLWCYFYFAQLSFSLIGKVVITIFCLIFFFFFTLQVG